MAARYVELARRDPVYCQVQRNCILFHRSCISLLSYQMKEQGLNRAIATKLILEHAIEIRNIYRELDFACSSAN